MRLTSRWAMGSLGLLGFFATAGVAPGAIVYHYAAGQPSYSASPGQPLSVPIFLRETVSGGDASLLVSEGGLFGAGFSVSTTGTSVSYTFARNTADFSDQSANATGWAVNVGLSPTGVMGTASGPDVRQVLLGHLNFNAGSGNTTFDLAKYDNLGGNTLTNKEFFDLDFPAPGAAYAAAQGTSVVIAVPEPAGAALLLLVPAAALLRRRRQGPAREAQPLFCQRR